MKSKQKDAERERERVGVEEIKFPLAAPSFDFFIVRCNYVIN